MKGALIRSGVRLIVDKVKTVNEAESAINTIIDLFEKSTHWTVKNKPIKLEIDDSYRKRR